MPRAWTAQFLVIIFTKALDQIDIIISYIFREEDFADNRPYLILFSHVIKDPLQISVQLKMRQVL